MDTFGDVEFYQAKKQVKQRLDKILTEIQKTVKQSPQTVKICQRFRGCLENPENIDPGRLPYFSTQIKTHTKSKHNCILAMLSSTVQLYWRFCCKEKSLESVINNRLNVLAEIIENGLNAYKISGTKYPGYYLEKK